MIEARRNPGAAHLSPLVAFLGIGALAEWGGFGERAMLWVYPLQALVGLALVGFYWPAYTFSPLRGWGWVLLTAPLGFALWIAPSWLYARWGAPAWLESSVPMLDLPWRVALGLAERSEGFDPGTYEGTWLSPAAGMVLRFLRLLVTVPLVEEICWRGFVMRLVDDPDRPFHENPFGRHRWRTFGIVTGMVVLAHQPVDWVGAFVFGSMAYFIAVRTKSLAACVVFHAGVNLLLGLYVVMTRQWGFW